MQFAFTFGVCVANFNIKCALLCFRARPLTRSFIRSFYEKVQSFACFCTGGGRRGRVKSISLILISTFILSGAFFSCANNSGGGGSSEQTSDASGTEGGGNTTLPSGGNADNMQFSTAKWTCATSEKTTAIGNSVSEVLCLFDENKFEWRKIISYSDGSNETSFFQIYYKGTYSGNVLDGLTFDIKEELDTESFDEEMKQVLGLEGAETQTAQSQKAMVSARVASRDIAAILADCQEKLKKAKFKTSKDKNMSFNPKNMELKDADGKTSKVTEKALDGYINLDGFLFTGNPCNTRNGDPKADWHWASTEEEGAKRLEKTADGKYTCQFRADGNDTLIRIIYNNWLADWGLSAIDKEKSTLPKGAGITDDTHAVNNTPEQEKYQDPRNIAITGLEAKRKYDITFDTKKSPGKICIELAEHKISTLDGWLFTGTKDNWSGKTNDETSSFKKIGDNSWQISFTAKEGWNGFKFCKENWSDEIGWSSFDWEEPYGTYGGNKGSNVGNYASEDDDVIQIGEHDFDGTEKVTITFGIKNGRVTCETEIEYTREFQVNGLYVAYSEDEKPVLIKDNKVNFTAANSINTADGPYTPIWLLDKIDDEPPKGGSLDGSFYYYDDGGACWYDGTSYY